MSYDRQIDQVCPHIISEEALFVGADRITVRPLRPIASVASVDVFLNHEIQVPPQGVTTPASSSGTANGPFNITLGSNDTLALTVNQGAVQTATIPAASQVPPDRIAAILNASLQGVIFSVLGSRLTFQSTDKGRSASIFMKSTGLATTLGIQSNREYRGKQIVPGWTVISDPNTLSDRPTRLIIFDEPLRGQTDFVEIGYNTISQECRRCGGTRVEHDFRYSKNGEPIQVVDEALLIQELQKDFFTIRGSNPFHTWYGSALLDTIGKKLTAGGFLQNLIVSDIYQAFNRWQSIKRQQEEKVGQFVSDREFPFRLLSVDLQQSTQDPTIIFVSITVQNRSSDPIQIERGLKLPQPIDLLGSTAQQGQIRQSLSNFVLTG